MKKLMFMLAAVALATCTQAASMDWAVTVASLDAKNDAFKDYQVYICSSLADGGFASTDDISDYLYGSAGNTGASVQKTTRKPFNYIAADTARNIDDADEGMQTVYAVILSKDGKGYWAASMSGEVYTTATEPTVAKLDASALIAGDYTPWATTPPPGPTPGGIPEPTSGLLLVVGGAMLALRRRRA